MAENPWAARRVFDTTDTGAPTVDGSLGGHLLIAYGQAQVNEGPLPDADQVSSTDEGPEATVEADVALVNQEADVEQHLGVSPTTEHEEESITPLPDLATEVFGEVEPPWIPTRADLDAMRSDEPVVVKVPVKKTAARKKKPGSSK